MAAMAFGAIAQDGYNWSFSLGAGLDDQVADIETDDDGNIYICGSFSANASFGPSKKIQTKGGRDGFAAKLDRDRKITWIKQIGSMSDVVINKLTVDEVGNVYTIGTYSTDFTVYEAPDDTTVVKLKQQSQDRLHGNFV